MDTIIKQAIELRKEKCIKSLVTYWQRYSLMKTMQRKHICRLRGLTTTKARATGDIAFT